MEKRLSASPDTPPWDAPVQELAEPEAVRPPESCRGDDTERHQTGG